MNVFNAALLLIVQTVGARQRPNVLMFVVDDLRAEFGQTYVPLEVLTPHIDALARRAGSTVFRKFYV